MNDFLTYGLFGRRVSNSLAPQIYNALFDELGVLAVYIPFPVEKERFVNALPVLRSEFSGFDVDQAYGLDILIHIDQLDENAKKTGAVNTVIVKEGKLTGYNTDGLGFERSLVGFMGNLYDKDVLLIGAGSAAYSAAQVLLGKGAFLSIVSGNAALAAALRDKLQSRFNKNRIRVIKELTGDDVFYAAVNTDENDIEGRQSSISIHNNTYSGFKYAYDTHIGMTAFLKKAGDFGANTKDGFDMLFYKSAGALELWQGKGTLSVSAISNVYDKVKSNLEASLNKE